MMHKHVRRRWLHAALSGSLGAAAVFAVLPASAHDGQSRHGPMMAHWGGGHGPGAGNVDPERMKSRLNDRVRRVLGQVGASEAQITQVQGIWASAMTDLASIGTERRTARQALSELLSRPTIDRRALEDARKQNLALADRQSQRFTQAMADAAEVLDPQQRAKLAEMMKNRRNGPRGPGMRGEGGFGPFAS